MAIDSVGNAFVTAGNQLWQIDLVNPMNSVLLGDLGVDESGEPWYSSGDCVLNKSDSLYMSAKRTGIAAGWHPIHHGNSPCHTVDSDRPTAAYLRPAFAPWHNSHWRQSGTRV